MTDSAARPAQVWVIDTRASRLTVKAFAGGMLSAFGHSPTFVVRDYRGEVTFDPESAVGGVRLVLAGGSLAVQDDVSEKDRREIERVAKDEVLETAKHPEVEFACPAAEVKRVGEGQFEVTLPGSLTLHGVTNREPIRARVAVTGPMLRAFGQFTLSQQNYEIKPVSLAGMIKVKDALAGTFDIVARK